MISCEFCPKFTNGDDSSCHYQYYRPFDRLTRKDYLKYCTKLMCFDCWLRISKELRNKTAKPKDLKSSQDWYTDFNPYDYDQDGACAGSE